MITPAHPLTDSARDCLLDALRIYWHRWYRYHPNQWTVAVQEKLDDYRAWRSHGVPEPEDVAHPRLSSSSLDSLGGDAVARRIEARLDYWRTEENLRTLREEVSDLEEEVSDLEEELDRARVHLHDAEAEAERRRKRGRP